ncbi:hypothetical protein ACP275_14G251400 [Erythranthe tilingii]
MDNQTSFLLNWTYSHQDKSMDEELRQTLLLTMELEETRVKAQDELRMRDEQITELQQLLSLAIQERNEAQEKCQKVLFEKLLLQKQLQHQRTPNSGVSTIEDDDPRRGIDFSSSDCEESIVSSPPHHHLPPPPPPTAELPVVIDRPLPEKGKFLQAVMKAGPLLQTLLLAGPLPQWRHPPPPLDPYQIPPPPLLIAPPPPLLHTHHPINQDPNNCGRINTRKRDLFERSDSSIDQSKHQKILLR